MNAKIRKLVLARDTLKDIDSALSCIGVAVTARELQHYERDGAFTILQWSKERIGDCRHELGALIDQLGSAPN